MKSPTVPVKEYRILTPEEFDRLYDVLPSAGARLVIETLIDSGLRWGELAELRVRDIHRPSGIVTVSRSVVEIDPKFHPSGERFAVKPYPKGKRSRRFRLSAALLASLWHHIEMNGTGPDELVFSFSHLLSAPLPVTPLADVAALGMTEPNERGRSYRHGTRDGSKPLVK